MNMNSSTKPTNNIEPLARAICEQALRRPEISESALTADVDRYWHCVAARIEAGFINDDNSHVPHTLEQGLDAYQDWCARHPVNGS